MKKISLILFLIFLPTLAYGSTAGDFLVNNQSTYTVPPGSTNVLILDLTLPGAGLTSIKINNAGTLQEYDISQLSIFEDGSSPGWDGDESERARKLSSPFFDTPLNGDFTQQRIFVTVNINSTTYTRKTIKPELEINAAVFASPALNGPTDQKITGLERMVLAGADTPTVPVSPLARSGEALSTSTIRWYFMDLSNNELGFKVLDGNLKVVARKEEANLSYLDETGLQPDTDYSGRQVFAFNDRGESLSSALTVFPATRTLAERKTTPIKEVVSEPTSSEPAVIQEIKKEPTLFETIQTKIADIQRQVNELLQRLNELIQQQAATIWQALAGFLRAFFGK